MSCQVFWDISFCQLQGAGHAFRVRAVCPASQGQLTCWAEPCGPEPGSTHSPSCCPLSLCCVRFAEPWVQMDVAESPERDPRSPEDEEEQPTLSDDDILRESGSDQDLDGAGGRASDLEDEERAAPVLGREEENRSDEEDRASEPKSQDQDSEVRELSRGQTGSPCEEEGDNGEEDRTSDLRDEASSVTRELDEHELDYDEEVPEESAPAVQEDEAEKAGAEDEEEKGDSAPAQEGKPTAQSGGEKEPLETAKEKKKEDDDGEIDDGEIDVSMTDAPPAGLLPTGAGWYRVHLGAGVDGETGMQGRGGVR